MFKAQVLRRNFSLFNRVPTSRIIQAAARDGHETFHIQRVRIKKPFFRRSRLVGLAFCVAGYSALQRALDGEEEAERDQNHANRPQRRDSSGGEIKNDDEEQEQDEEDEDVLLFLPTGLSRPRPQTYYKGSDPEWQEFIRIAPDRKRMDRLRAELVFMARDAVSKSPAYRLRLGKVNMTTGVAWLETKFPDGPPVEFERPGIEITEELTARWSTRPVNEIHHRRLSNILVPTAAANSLYGDTRVKVSRKWRELKRYVGWDVKPQSTAPWTLVTGVPDSPSTGSHSPRAATANSPAGSPLAPSTTNDHQAQSAPPTPSSQKESTPALSSSPDAPKRINIVLPNLSFFRRSFQKQYHPLRDMQPPRGTFIMHGLIEIIGTKARMTVDVAAVYDPKTARYIMLTAKMRSLTDLKQVPKGGPGP
ncbi:hypothetical protein BDV95DRAFT_577595 [Massariosphaeria phaeospora]|uniref:Uncharacterized protein n=1 Tax=Massariosphaeria phaeospora TaxID=100035 RepID=A0A7C8MHE5_9PLEO|nr:hypothetical protein BDV95DRAFT_577595 [Massariosphaeria phaeospora]